MTTAEQSTGRYDYHEQYYSLNTGAHRKGGVELVTPTLTHHLGLWYPPILTSGLAERSVDRFGTVVDRYVWTLYKGLRDLQDFETNFGFSHDEERVVCLFGGIYHADGDVLRPYGPNGGGFHFALEDARDSDNKILFLKALWQGLTIIVRCEFHSEYFTATRFVTVTNFAAIPPSLSEIGTSMRQLADLNKNNPAADQITENANLQLYRRIWEILDEQLFDWTKIFEDVDSLRRLRIFADFRGLVISGDDTAAKSPLSLASNKGRAETRFAEGYAADDLLPSIWPFLKVKNGLDLKHREFTASYMLGRRAVYITALGPQPPANDQFDCAPLQYFLVARPVSDWQLGALVDRLHFMGTVRLAALMELSALRRAGANLRDMDREIDAARQSIEANDLATATRCHQNALKLIAHMDDNKPIFWSGLQFRVERSRYYFQRFKDFADFLGIGSIEGYQPYDLFVKGRLGGVYDYIDRLGRRQERATRSTESIFQLISLKEATETNRQNSIISQAIEKLQTKAEIALLAVIVPHYAMDIIHAFHEEYEHGQHTIFNWYAAILVVGVILALASLVAYVVDIARGGDERRLHEVVQKYAFLTIVSVCASFAIMHVRFW